MGMLFDHGSDAITALMSSIIMGRILHLGTGIFALFTFLVPTLPFFLYNL